MNASLEIISNYVQLLSRQHLMLLMHCHLGGHLNLALWLRPSPIPSQAPAYGGDEFVIVDQKFVLIAINLNITEMHRLQRRYVPKGCGCIPLTSRALWRAIASSK